MTVSVSAVATIEYAFGFALTSSEISVGFLCQFWMRSRQQGGQASFQPRCIVGSVIRSSLSHTCSCAFHYTRVAVRVLNPGLLSTASVMCTFVLGEFTTFLTVRSINNYRAAD